MGIFAIEMSFLLKFVLVSKGCHAEFLKDVYQILTNFPRSKSGRCMYGTIRQHKEGVQKKFPTFVKRRL